MKKISIGVQLYSVRGDVAQDAAGTLAAIKKMGYEGVEFAGLHKHSATEWKAMFDGNGLCAAGTHIGIDTIYPENLQGTIDTYAAIGCTNLVVPGLPPEYTSSLDGLRRACSIMNLAAVPLAKAGIALGYHNHAAEFKFLENHVPYELMLKCFTTDVFLQLDFGNFREANIDGIKVAHRFPKRLRTVHLKAYKADCKTAVIGEDDIQWTSVFDACESAGTLQWYIVEHEVYANPPMVCVKQCRDNLRKLGR